MLLFCTDSEEKTSNVSWGLAGMFHVYLFVSSKIILHLVLIYQLCVVVYSATRRIVGRQGHGMLSLQIYPCLLLSLFY